MTEDYIKNQFVSYKVALKLKELGFDEECFGFYDRYLLDSDVELKIEPNKRTNSYFIKAKANNCCLAPLWQQAISFINKLLLKCGYYHYSDNYIWEDFSNLKSMELDILKAIELCQKEK